MIELPTTTGAGYTQQPCVFRHPVSITVSNGSVTLTYADWGQNEIHYRGRIDADGGVEAWHVNADGTRSVLTGQMTTAGFVGYMDRDQQACPYKVVLSDRTLLQRQPADR
jgi:hypothetical protein